MPAANTGKEIINKKLVIKILQINKGINSQFIILGRHINPLVKKLIELKIEETPAKCKEKIKKSTVKLLKPSSLLKGGYKVHPVPGPKKLKKTLNKIKINLKGINQKENLFSRGKIKSGIIR
jgi:paraquat-inducible protein B